MIKELRLSKNKEFRKVYKYGKSSANKELVLFILDNYHTEQFRIGISVSKKIGNAVKRNRVKRLIKESLNSILDDYYINKKIDIVIIARNPTRNMDFYRFKKSLLHILNKTNIISKK